MSVEYKIDSPSWAHFQMTSDPLFFIICYWMDDIVYGYWRIDDKGLLQKSIWFHFGPQWSFLANADVIYFKYANVIQDDFRFYWVKVGTHHLIDSFLLCIVVYILNYSEIWWPWKKKLILFNKNWFLSHTSTTKYVFFQLFSMEYFNFFLVGHF